MALVISSVLGAAATLLSVNVLAIYGWGLFVALPFCLGFFSVLLYGYHRPRSLRSCLAVASMSVVLLGLFLLALAVEGVICLAMAAPIGLILALMGGSMGYLIQQKHWDRFQTRATFSALLLFVPFFMGTEALKPQQPPLLQITTQIEINAPPEEVWPFLTSFPTLPPPTEWPFRIGISYPIRSTLRGSGLGAQRECQFSSGQFIEPIQVWQENKRLGFSISGEPLVMEELSPYGHIHTRHIDGGYFQAQDAEFVLTQLPGGRTLLAGHFPLQKSNVARVLLAIVVGRDRPPNPHASLSTYQALGRGGSSCRPRPAHLLTDKIARTSPARRRNAFRHDRCQPRSSNTKRFFIKK